MLKATLLLLLLAQAPTGSTKVDGTDLKSRHAAAIKQGAAQRGPFWTAYTFPVRPGIVFDAEIYNSGEFKMLIGGTQNVGIFLLHQGSNGDVLRAEIYELNRPRDYAGYPVYWLDKGPSNESLAFLREVLNKTSSPQAADRLVDAIGAHDDPRVTTTLRDIVQNVKLDRARTEAVSWLGRLPGQIQFLADLVRNERESLPVRREAAESLGDSPDAAAVPAIQNLYRNVTNREVKAELIEALGDSNFEAAALPILIEIAERETVPSLRHEAIESLGEIAPERSVPVLVRLYDSSSSEETKKEILEALGDSEVEAAWQKLVAVARQDPSVRLRKEAIEILGDSDDPRAGEFLEQLVRQRR
jgi:HEAT repeat protein